MIFNPGPSLQSFPKIFRKVQLQVPQWPKTLPLVTTIPVPPQRGTWESFRKSMLHVLNEYWPEEGGRFWDLGRKKEAQNLAGFFRWQQSDPGREVTTAKSLLDGRWAVTPSHTRTCWRKSAWLLAAPAPRCLQASFCLLALPFVLCSSSFLELPDVAITKGDAG